MKDEYSDESAPCLVSVTFGEGSLGVTLRRRSDGSCYVGNVLPNSQAVQLDVQALDELWEVGPHPLHGEPVDKQHWDELVKFMVDTPRPLVVQLRRRSPPSGTPTPTDGAEATSTEGDAVEGSHSQLYEATTAVHASGSNTSDLKSVPEPTGQAVPDAEATAEAEALAQAEAEDSLSALQRELSDVDIDAPIGSAANKRFTLSDLDLSELQAEIEAEEAEEEEEEKKEEEAAAETTLAMTADERLSALLAALSLRAREPEGASLFASLTNSGSSRSSSPAVFEKEGEGGYDSTMRKPETGLAYQNFSVPGGTTASPEALREAAHSLLYKDGRTLLRHGEVDVSVPGTLWSSMAKRHLLLFDDVLVVAREHPPSHSPSSSSASASRVTVPAEEGSGRPAIELPRLEVLNVLPLQQVHLHCPAGAAPGPATAFEVWHAASSSGAGGALEVTASTGARRALWVRSIWAAVCACNSSSGESPQARVFPGWRHKYLLGTIHSTVCSGASVQEALQQLTPAAAAERVNAADEEGLCPLHYAVLFGAHGAVQVLLSARARPLSPDSCGLSALHYAALLLDAVQVDMLAAAVASSLNGADATLASPLGNPLYAACVYGRSRTSGRTDGSALASVVASLAPLYEPFAEDVCVCGGGGEDDLSPPPLHFVCAAWETDAASELLAAQAEPSAAALMACLKGQLPRPLVGGMRKWRELHADHAAQEGATVAADQELHTPLPSAETAGVAVLRALLQAGARPNAKVAGKSPLALLLESAPRWEGAMAAAVGLLVSHGARWETVGAEAEKALKSLSGAVSADAMTMWAASGGATLDLLPSAGGDEDAHAGPASPMGSSSGRHSPAPGAEATKSDKSCALCDAAFGLLFKRKHRCAACNTEVCDACSKRPATLKGAAVRACDGCFNRARHSYAVRPTSFSAAHKGSDTDTFAAQRARSKSAPPSASQASAAAAKANREGLLAGARPPSEKVTGGDRASSTQSTLSEAKEALQQRGEKLEQVNEKSEELRDAASLFSQMAKDLNKQQSNRWF